jgi:hypothetical protein
VSRSLAQCLRYWSALKVADGYDLTSDATDPRAVSLTTVPDARTKVVVELAQSELGVYTLDGASGIFAPPTMKSGFGTLDGGGPVATGVSPSVSKPDNAALNARLAHDPVLRSPVSVRTVGSFTVPAPDPEAPSTPAASSPASPQPRAPEKRATTADVLEALHRATGMPIVADYYTRLYAPSKVTVASQPLFHALNQVADEMRFRWNKEAGWLQFRSTSYYDDRLKEVPNRLLARWAQARSDAGGRQAHEGLTLEELVEIAGLTDAQLDGNDMAEGAKIGYGLAEWDLVRAWPMRPHLRYLATLSPTQRQETLTPGGLPFTRMTLAQQQRYLALAIDPNSEPLQSLEELAGATLRVDYTQPGWFEWRIAMPPWMEWVVMNDIKPGTPKILRPPVRERTREAAQAAARSFDPQLRATMVEVMRKLDPRPEAIARIEQPEITPTRYRLTVIYVPGLATRRVLHVLRPGQDLRTGGI